LQPAVGVRDLAHDPRAGGAEDPGHFAQERDRGDGIPA
jgi:hypothetical protein